MQTFFLFASFIDKQTIYVIPLEGSRGQQTDVKWRSWLEGGRIQTRDFHVQTPQTYPFDHLRISTQTQITFYPIWFLVRMDISIDLLAFSEKV